MTLPTSQNGNHVTVSASNLYKASKLEIIETIYKRLTSLESIIYIMSDQLVTNSQLINTNDALTERLEVLEVSDVNPNNVNNNENEV